MYREHTSEVSAFGHICRGGGATIKDSPINIHIHIHTNEATLIQKSMRCLGEIFSNRNRTIENASQLTESELQRCISRAIENR